MKQKEIIFILASIFFVVLFWIGFSIYHNSVTSTIPEAVKSQVESIAPNFDAKTFEKLKNRTKIEPAFEIEGGVSDQQASNSALDQNPVSSQSAISQGGGEQ